LISAALAVTEASLALAKSSLVTPSFLKTVYGTLDLTTEYALTEFALASSLSELNLISTRLLSESASASASATLTLTHIRSLSALVQELLNILLLVMGLGSVALESVSTGSITLSAIKLNDVVDADYDTWHVAVEEKAIGSMVITDAVRV
jgi:hypothetical protein